MNLRCAESEMKDIRVHYMGNVLRSTIWYGLLAIIACTCTDAIALPTHNPIAPFVAVDDPRELKDDELEDCDPSYRGLSEKELLDIMIAEEIAALDAVGEHLEDSVTSDATNAENQAAQAPDDATKTAPTENTTDVAGDDVDDDDLERLFAEEYGIGKDLSPYRLRIGDRLFISIYGEGNTGRVTMVDHTGSINYLLVGEMFVLGKTIEELRYEMNQIIKNYFQHAVVAITPIEFGSQYYTILGQVKRPGKKVITGKPSLLSALAEAGGFTYGSFRTQTIELADLTHSFVARDGDYIPVDFTALVTKGDTRQDIDLLSGDYIHIPNALYREISILGEVRAPTTLGYIHTISLVEAIAQARGLTNRASSRVLVIRGSLAYPRKYMIDINLILRGLEPDFILKAGDIVYCPPRRFQHLRDIVHLGVRAFVSAIASQAGSNQFIRMTPAAVGLGIEPVIPIGPFASPQATFVGPGVSSGFP